MNDITLENVDDFLDKMIAAGKEFQKLKKDLHANQPLRMPAGWTLELNTKGEIELNRYREDGHYLDGYVIVKGPDAFGVFIHDFISDLFEEMNRELHPLHC